MYCCGDRRNFKKYCCKKKKIALYYMEECPRCLTSRIILLDNNIITKTHGKNARKLFDKYRLFLKEERLPSLKAVLEYIPMKYYCSVKGNVQKEMYSGCDISTGIRKISQLAVKRI